MDEGDRSGERDDPDRETGSAESDTVSDDLADSGVDVGSDPDADDDGDNDGVGGGSEPADEGRDEAGPFGTETDRGGTETDRGGTETDRPEAGPSRPEPEPSRNASASDEGGVHRFRHDREGPLMWIREMLSSVAVVLVIGLILFGVSGVWPPMVAVESGSMEPNMEVGDLVFVTEPGRLAPDAADNDVGVVTHEVGETVDYRTFGSYGSVVIYRPPGRTASPIIHRAMFHVEEGENWYDRADEEYHNAAGCGELRNCPAPHSGFITLGDNNGAYDQANGLAPPVKAEWVTGVARVRVPYLGYVRLIASGQAELSDVLATTVAAEAEAVDRVGETEDSAAASDEFSKPTVSGGGSIASASA